MLPFDELFGFVFLIIGGIEIRCFCFKFPCTGIYHLIDGVAVHRALLSGNTLDGFVQVTILFSKEIEIFGQRLCGHFPFQFYQIQQLVQEPAVYHGQCMKFFYGFSAL